MLWSVSGYCLEEKGGTVDEGDEGEENFPYVWTQKAEFFPTQLTLSHHSWQPQSSLLTAFHRK